MFLEWTMAFFLVNFFSLVKLARGLCKVCFGRCNSEGLQRDRNVCFREHLCSEQRYILANMLNILRLFSALRIRSPFWLTPSKQCAAII